jgi:hypothetical protein
VIFNQLHFSRRGGITVKTNKTKLLSTTVLPMVAAAAVAVGSGLAMTAPAQANSFGQGIAAELPAAKARVGGVQLAACNPCAAKAPCNPCAAKNPCNPCAAKNPCNPCAAKNPCNPCAAKKQ